MTRPSASRTVRGFGTAAALLAAVGVVSCGGATAPELDEQAAGDLGTALSTAVTVGFALALEDGGSIGAAAPGGAMPPLAAEPRAWSFDRSGACPGAGTARSRGDGTVESTDRQGGGRSHQWSWEADLAYSSCGVIVEAGTYFVSTDSDLDFSGTGQVETEGGEVVGGSFDWQYGGRFDWTDQGGPTGSCDVSLSTTVTFQGGTGQRSWSGTIEGTICGRQVERGWTTTIQP